MAKYQIRADFDATTIVVYQAYPDRIADPALAAGRFVAPFSFSRMTWIKPSFLWLMHRSNWGTKNGQTRILAIRISRAGWDQALAAGVLTVYDHAAHLSKDDWYTQFQQAQVHVQWDPERSLRSASTDQMSIQVGISRHLIQRYVDDWVVAITDITPTVRKIHDQLRSGRSSQAKRLLPPERPYPVAADLGRRLLIEPASSQARRRR